MASKPGMGKPVDVFSDKWPGANVKQSRLNAGSDKTWKGSRKESPKKKLVVK